MKTKIVDLSNIYHKTNSNLVGISKSTIHVKLKLHNSDIGILI